MQIGCHVSISGSIDKAVDNAVERKCSAFQIFTRNPRGWNAKELTKEDIANFKSKLKESKIERLATCAHMPYLPNLASPKVEGFEKSVKTLIDEIERCSQLGIPYLVTHLGSHLGTGEEGGIKRLVEGLSRAGKTSKDVMILLENTAGQKNSVGSDFKQLGEIFNQLKSNKILYSEIILFGKHTYKFNGKLFTWEEYVNNVKTTDGLHQFQLMI
ncbi:MAG: hypothetical protein COA77_09460 [Thaumarchaeota archaeon]|nr:MAG: hypothetical protein COA77_09460 [Nitrososphaerota archaeon]